MALQKNPGPLLTSWFKGLVDHIPPEWRARLGLKKRDQQDPVDIDPDAIAGVLVNSEVAQTRTDERKKSDIELGTDPTGVALNQQKRLANGQIVTEVRTFVPEGTPLAGIGVETIEAEQKNLGIGWMTNDITDATLPGPTVESSQIDHDGVVVQVLKTRKLRSTITEGETLVGGIWTKVTEEGETDLVATEVVQKRTIPGVSMGTTKLAEDGALIVMQTTYKETITIVPGETLIGAGAFWVKTSIAECSSIMGASDIVSDEVVESRPLPGHPMISVKIDKDSNLLDTVRTLKVTDSINPHEEITPGNVWVKYEIEAVSDVVAWEVVTARTVPGNSVPSAVIGGDQEVQNVHVILKNETAITPSSSESGGFITTVEKKAVSDFVAEEVTTVTKWVDKATYAQSIPDSIIPLEFRAQIPTVVESHIVAGVASMPTLVGSQISTEERQLTKLLKEVRNSSFGESITFPIDQIGYELTEEYGGGVLEVKRRLNNALLTVEEGEDVVNSTVQPIGEAYLWFRTTSKRFGVSEWPLLHGTEVDPRTGIVVEVDRQVVNAGTLGGVVGGVYTDAKSIDKWRTLTIASKLQAGSLPATRTWETTMEHSFPNTLNGAIWLWQNAVGVLVYDFDMVLLLDMTQGYAGPCRALITESFTDGPPSNVVAITQFFPQAHRVGYTWGFAASLTTECDNCTDSARAQARGENIPPSLHDTIDLTGSVSFAHGSFTDTLAATVPTELPPPGTLITKAVEVEPWRFNIFYRKMVQIYVP